MQEQQPAQEHTGAEQPGAEQAPETVMLDDSQALMDQLGPDDQRLPRELRALIRRLKKGKQPIRHTTLQFAPRQVPSPAPARFDGEIPPPRRGGTFLICRYGHEAAAFRNLYCGRRFRRMRAYRRHWLRDHA